MFALYLSKNAYLSQKQIPMNIAHPSFVLNSAVLKKYPFFHLHDPKYPTIRRYVDAVVICPFKL